MDHQRIAVLIPAYKPDARLIELVDALRAAGFERLVVVDDGGGAAFKPIFDALNDKAKVLTHIENRGKGAALKTGLAYIMKKQDVSVVTADADGQHTPEDIRKIAEQLEKHPDALALGVRDKRQMPTRSKLGNNLTCFFFGLTTGLWLTDTQTGLRGLPASTLPALATLDGDRYEYELNMLIFARRQGIPVEEVAIETIYIDDNASSHFNALRDGFRIYKLLFGQLIAFAGSSLLAGLIDYGAFALLHLFMPNNLFFPVVLARIISSTINYLVNRQIVFKAQSDMGSTLRYYLLVVAILLLSYAGTSLLSFVGGVTAFIAKPLIDGLLFLLSYNIQRWIVFKKQKA